MSSGFVELFKALVSEAFDHAGSVTQIVTMSTVLFQYRTGIEGDNSN